MRKAYAVPAISAIICAIYALTLRLDAQLLAWHRAQLVRLYGTLGRMSAGSPLPLAELLALAALMLVALSLAIALARTLLRRRLRPLKRWLAAMLALALPAAPLLFTLWPVHADSSARTDAAYARAYTTDELAALIRALDAVLREHEPDIAFAGGAMRLTGSKERLAERAADAYVTAGLTDAPAVPRMSGLPGWMARMGIAGMFVPFTGEALINPDDMDSALPFTMLHEIAHSLGALREDEANLTALHVALRSGDAELAWSAALTAMRYALSLMRAADTAAFDGLLAAISPGARNELHAQNAFADRSPAAVLPAMARPARQTVIAAPPPGDYEGLTCLLLHGRLPELLTP